MIVSWNRVMIEIMIGSDRDRSDHDQGMTNHWDMLSGHEPIMIKSRANPVTALIVHSCNRATYVSTGMNGYELTTRQNYRQLRFNPLLVYGRIIPVVSESTRVRNTPGAAYTTTTEKNQAAVALLHPQGF